MFFSEIGSGNLVEIEKFESVVVDGVAAILFISFDIPYYRLINALKFFLVSLFLKFIGTIAVVEAAF